MQMSHPISMRCDAMPYLYPLYSLNHAYLTLGCAYCGGNGGGKCCQYWFSPPLLPFPQAPCGGCDAEPPAQPFCIIGGGRGGGFCTRVGRLQRRTIQPRMLRRRRPPTPQAMPMTRLRLSWIQEPTSFATEEPLHWPFLCVSVVHGRELAGGVVMRSIVGLTLTQDPPPPQTVPSKKFCCML